MTFWRTVAAYLTGWLIVNPSYTRVLKLWRRRELANPSPETRDYFNAIAKAVVDEQEARQAARAAMDARHAL